MCIRDSCVLAAYALSMTAGGGAFGALNLALLAGGLAGAAVFVFVESRVASPLVRLALFRNPVLSAGLPMNALVSTVMMATLVVGPFYLTRVLGLDDARVGLVVAVGPLISIFCGVPAGRMVDRLGAPRMAIIGLVALAAGSAALATLPELFGVPGYIAALMVLTPGYQLFQAANNTSVMADVAQDQRGVTSGLLNLSRNLGLITGASFMGAVFALAAGTVDLSGAAPDAVATGMKAVFAVGALLMTIALAIAAIGQGFTRRRAVAETLSD